ncbi:MAG: hypothetical protein J0H65_10800 [Rhizobiales bacterium]|nr:hypothetical protein [Hyphomicrobiales bacterium]
MAAIQALVGVGACPAFVDTAAAAAFYGRRLAAATQVPKDVGIEAKERQ